MPFTFKEFHSKKVEVLSWPYLNRLNSMLLPKVNKSGLLKRFLRVVLAPRICSNEHDTSFSSSQMEEAAFSLMAEKETKLQVY